MRSHAPLSQLSASYRKTLGQLADRLLPPASISAGPISTSAAVCMRKQRLYFNKRFQCFLSGLSTPRRGNMARRHTRQQQCSSPPDELLCSQRSTRSRVSKSFFTCTTPSCPQDDKRGRCARAAENAHEPNRATAGSAEVVGVLKEGLEQPGGNDAELAKDVAATTVSNGQYHPLLCSLQNKDYQATDNATDNDSDCVVVLTGARIAATTACAALISSDLPVFTVAHETRFRKGQARMRPRFSFPRMFLICSAWTSRHVAPEVNSSQW